MRPRKPLRDVPITTGRPIATISSSRRSSSSGAGQAAGSTSNPSAKIQWKAIVRWESALPVREALKKSAPKDVEDFYVLNVIGNLPSAVTNDQPDSASSQYLKDVTKLEHKGDLIHLSRVELVPENDLSPAGTLFYFSRMLALMPKDKEALFSTKIGPLDLKCKFTLGEMFYRGALEL